MTRVVAGLARSYLYVPADAPDRLNRAHLRAADAVIADLEDAVATSRKAPAVAAAAAWFQRTDIRSEQWVRINAGDRGLEEIAKVFGPSLTGVCLPKTSSASDVQRLTDVLDDLERHAGSDGPPAAIMPLIETARGLQALPELAALPRVHRLQVGELDLAADLGLEPGAEELELLPLRASVVVAAAVAGLPSPVGPVSPDFDDLISLEASCRRLRRAGFFGRAAIHPKQIPVIHRSFTPTPEELSEARAMIDRYETSLANGIAVFVDHNGRMVDEAVVRHCRRTVALAAAGQEGGPHGY